ncbi:hypothetical protein CY35_08G042100 [Sphagnum magellanicum]|nr:hypothetical protein CY35_08G042100 [Sphagnum magellanicum]
MESGLSVAELRSQQLLARCDNSGNECFMQSDVAPSLPEPHGCRTTEASGENFGEVLAAIPFKWEVEPGIPNLPRSRRSRRPGRVDECSVELPARRPLASQSSSAIKLSPRFQAEMREMLEPSVGKHRPDEYVRPLASQSSSAIKLSPRFQAEMREMLEPSVGKHRPDEYVRPLASQSSSAIKLSPRFQAEMREMLEPSVGKHRPDEYVRPLASQSSSAIKLSARFQAEMREMLASSFGKHRPDEYVRPLASQSSSAIKLSARFQAEMREVLASSFGKHRPDEFVIGKLPIRRPLASQSTSAFHLTAKFQSEMLATSFRDYTPEEFVIGQTLPLPPRLRALNKQIALDSHEFQQCDNMFGIEEAPAPIHGGHRRYRSFSYAIERPRKEASVEDCRASCGLNGILPFLKEKMSWRIVKRLQRHLTNKFPQNGGNKVDHSTDYSGILDFSPNHPDSGYAIKVEKENDGPKALTERRASFRNLAALSRTAKSSLRIYISQSCEQRKNEVLSSERCWSQGSTAPAASRFHP